MAWTLEIYQHRIDNPGERTRHPAGSPSPEEIESYFAACDGVNFEGTALVLGMTPELRNLAVQKFKQVISVDSSQVAIDLFSNWIPEEMRGKETMILGSWTDLNVLAGQRCEVIFGDGIIGNLTDFQGALSALNAFRDALAPGGRCIMRNVVVGAGLDIDRYRFHKLLDDFRSEAIDTAEFGFCTRMLGFHDNAYDPERGILDCARVFEQLDAMTNLSANEVAALARYRFVGKNYFPSEARWLELLASAGFGPPVTHPSGRKLWNEFYPVQSFAPI